MARAFQTRRRPKRPRRVLCFWDQPFPCFCDTCRPPLPFYRRARATGPAPPRPFGPAGRLSAARRAALLGFLIRLLCAWFCDRPISRHQDRTVRDAPLAARCAAESRSFSAKFCGDSIALRYHGSGIGGSQGCRQAPRNGLDWPAAARTEGGRARGQGRALLVSADPRMP
jgi:hypothetical protein